jgi:hypothetical protein
MAPCRGVLLALLSFTVRRTDGFCGNSRSTATTSTITTSTATGSTPPIRTLVASCAAKKAKSSSFEDNPFGDPFGDPFSDAYGDEMADDAAPQSSASPAQKQLFADGGSSSSSSSDGGLDSSGDARRARQGAIRDVLGARQPHQRRDKVFPGSRVLLMLSSDLKGLSAEALKAAAEAAEEDESGEPFCPVEVLYEAVVEEVQTKEKTHPLGIKVRAVGGKSGRVARVLSPAEDAGTAARAAGASEGSQPIAANRGIRTQLQAAQSSVAAAAAGGGAAGNGLSSVVSGAENSAGKGSLPYSTPRDHWVTKGPAAKAAAALQAALDAEKQLGQQGQQLYMRNNNNGGGLLDGGGGGQGMGGGSSVVLPASAPAAAAATGRKFGEAGVKKMRRAVEEQRQAAAAAKQMAEQLGAESQAEGNSRPKPTRPAGSKAPYQKKRRKKKGGLGDRGQNFR